MFTRRTIDEARSPSEKADSIKGWRRKRYAAMAATRHAAATQSLRRHLRRKRNLCMAALPLLFTRRGAEYFRGTTLLTNPAALGSSVQSKPTTPPLAYHLRMQEHRPETSSMSTLSTPSSFFFLSLALLAVAMGSDAAPSPPPAAAPANGP